MPHCCAEEIWAEEQKSPDTKKALVEARALLSFNRNDCLYVFFSVQILWQHPTSRCVLTIGLVPCGELVKWRARQPTGRSTALELSRGCWTGDAEIDHF